MIKPGEAVKFLMTAAEGGFSFEQLPMSLADLILGVDQMEPAILYSRTFRMNRAGVENKQLFELMLLGLWGMRRRWQDKILEFGYGL